MSQFLRVFLPTSEVRFSGSMDHIYSIPQKKNLGGCRGTIHDFATVPFHLVLFLAALVWLAKFSPVHSCLPTCLPTCSYVYLFFFLSVCPKETSLLSHKTLRRGQTTSVSMPWQGSGVHGSLDLSKNHLIGNLVLVQKRQ